MRTNCQPSQKADPWGHGPRAATGREGPNALQPAKGDAQLSVAWSHPEDHRSEPRSIIGGPHMEGNEEAFGPIDTVVIGYRPDAPKTGEAVPILLDLVERG